MYQKETGVRSLTNSWNIATNHLPVLWCSDSIRVSQLHWIDHTQNFTKLVKVSRSLVSCLSQKQIPKKLLKVSASGCRIQDLCTQLLLRIDNKHSSTRQWQTRLPNFIFVQHLKLVSQLAFLVIDYRIWEWSVGGKIYEISIMSLIQKWFKFKKTCFHKR